MKKTAAALLLISVLAVTEAYAQEAPAPRRMPRTPVSREVLVEARDPMPASHQLQGAAAIIDGEKLRIGESDLRLFGIVPPQLSASFGPQARAALDALANGQSVTCQIRDRDRDGRLLATCHNSNGADMALELLKRGLAVTARGSIAGTEIATAYLAAEQAAQNQKIGIWSVTSNSTVPAIVTPAPAAPKQEAAAIENEKKEDKVAPRTDKTVTVPVALPDTQTQAKIAADLLAQQTQSRYDEAALTPPAADNAGFFERYQILIAGFLMLATALSIIGALWAQKRRDRVDEIKAVAAALRGELMAARAVCLGRVKEITSEEQDRNATWPRIRATLYQAYVGRLGLLGAELARQIASIYGQSSDYAALYNPANPASTMQNAPKKQAMEMLAKHIDDVLPRLAEIERIGHVASSAPRVAVSYQSPAAAPVGETATPAVTNYAAAATNYATSAAMAPVALWEAVRGFIQNHRNAIQQPHAAEPLPEATTQAESEYAAMIEADMARYQFGDNVETLDISPQKKRG